MRPRRPSARDETGFWLGENKEPNVSYHWERPVRSAQEHLPNVTGDGGDGRSAAVQLRVETRRPMEIVPPDVTNLNSSPSQADIAV